MTCTHCNDTGDTGSGYLDCIHCDAASLYAIPGAAARLQTEAPKLRALLAEYIDPVLPEGFKSESEWKIDFDTRVRVSLLRIVGSQAAKTVRAA